MEDTILTDATNLNEGREGGARECVQRWMAAGIGWPWGTVTSEK